MKTEHIEIYYDGQVRTAKFLIHDGKLHVPSCWGDQITQASTWPHPQALLVFREILEDSQAKGML